MKPLELITHLDRMGAKLAVKGDKLLCDAPKDAIGPDLLEAIKANKAELMALLEKDLQPIADNAEPTFRIVQREKAHPLSYAQKRMMVLHAMQTDEGVFNLALALELMGPLDIPKLDAAVKNVAGRHELLRTRFAWVNDEPVQMIESESSLSITQVDLRHLTGDGHANLTLKVADQERSRAFDVSRAPLFRASLIRRNTDEFILVLVSHYLIADEASMALIAREIRDYYNGKPAEEPPEGNRRFQYVDYVSWEAAFLSNPAGERQLRFWSDRFLQFSRDAHDSPMPAGHRMRFYAADNAEFELPENMTTALEALSREHQASLFMTTYAIFTLMIAAVANLHRVCCGTPIVNRTRMELEDMLGYFANTLVLGCVLSDEQTFTNYLGTVRTDVLAAFANGDIPFEFALEQTGTAAGPLTRWMYTFTEDDFDVLEFDRLPAQRLKLNENGNQNVFAELALFVRRTGNRLICSLLFAKDLFEPAVIDCLIRDFKKMAENVVKSPRTTIGDLITGCEATIYRRNRVLAPSGGDHLHPLSSPDDVYRAPRNDVERSLVAIWTDILGAGKISITANFFLLGGNSFQAVKMFAALHRQTGVKLPISSLYHAPTIELLARLLQDRENDQHWSPIVPIQTDGNRPPLFFVHGAGGNVLLYRDLSRRLGRQQPFYGIQAKGLDGRAELLTTVEAMADYYVKEIVKVQPEGPYYLGGYCLGGQIAYEMARNLSISGKTVAFVGLLDTQRRWHTDNGCVFKLRHQYQQIAFHLHNLWLADFKGKIAFLKEKTTELSRRVRRRLSVMTSTVAFALKLRSDRPLVLMEQINDRAAEKYIALPYNGTITLFCPKRNYAGYEDPLMGWGNGMAVGVDVQHLSMYPAGMLVDPFVGELAEKLRDALHRARPEQLPTHDS